MKININGDISEVLKGAEELSSYLGFSGEGEEFFLFAEKCEKGYSVEVKGGNIKISYNKRNDFFRAFSLAADAVKRGEELKIIEEPSFKKCGVMLDASRNAVLKVETVKSFIRYMARMGLNELMLYTEETYEIKKYPYFGHMRGRYTEEELKEIDCYGDMLGVEVIPCIQTLAHLEKALRWPCFWEVSDSDKVLLIDEEKTYELIEEMIKTVRRCFKTDKIHIGMDEAFGVGMGRYFEKHGLCDRFELLSRHLGRVYELTKKYGFSPMMWSDMFFRLGTKGGAYYDINPNLPENIEELIPEGLSQVYWDYYSVSEDMYNAMIKGHKKMNREIVFAGGIWTWLSPSVNYKQTFSSTIPALKVCKEQKIDNVFATMWGDDGAECDVGQALYGMQLYAELNYGGEYCEEKLKERFSACCGLSAEAFLSLDTEDFKGVEKYERKYDYSSDLCPFSKQMLYQNPMYGLFDKNASLIDIKKHYGEVYERISNVSENGEFFELFDCQKQYAKVLYMKCDLGIRLKDAYDRKDREELSAITEELYKTAEEVGVLHRKRKVLWYKNNKPFGFDHISKRLTLAKSALEIAYERVRDYLSGKVEILEELEEERLWADSEDVFYAQVYQANRIMAL